MAATRCAGAAGSLGLALVAVQHVVWMFSSWPLANDDELVRVVVGGAGAAEKPSIPSFVMVIVALTTAAYLVAARSGWLPLIGPTWVTRIGVWVVAGVLLARGVGGLVQSGLLHDGATEEYLRWDLRIYSPLCLLLAGLAVTVAWNRRSPQTS